ncbi:MAG: macrolide family glycosyltransferase [Ktedonobacteraceae bacterium]
MAKFVFINIPSRSHINPTLPIVQELVARGEEVTYYLTDTFKSLIEATGATFRSFDSRIEQINKAAFYGGKPVGLPMYMLDESLFVLPQILDSIRAEQPDCIVYDPMCLTGRLLTEILHIPAVVFRMIFVFNERLSSIFRANASQDPAGLQAFQASMNKVCAQYNIRPFHIGSIFSHEEPLNIVTIPRAFQIDGDSFGEQYCFVGPSITPREEHIAFPFEQLEKQPVVYITQGTVYNDRPDFFNLCFAAFAGTPWKVVLSLGNNVDRQKLDPIPDNFIVQSYLPQTEVLAYASVCVYHGSMTTTMEALMQGVPLVAIPQNIADEKVNARRIEELGLGVQLDEESLTAEKLRNAVLHISNDPTYYTRVRQMQAEIHAAGGHTRAADALIQYADVRI